MRRPNVAMSLAVVSWRRSGSPEAFAKTVRVMPSARAVRVILSAKFGSVPPRPSATVVATSFADLVTSALMASLTLMVEPGFRPSLDG